MTKFVFAAFSKMITATTYTVAEVPKCNLVAGFVCHWWVAYLFSLYRRLISD